MSQTPYIGEGQRQEAAALREYRSSQKRPLGKLPLIVVTNGQHPLKAALAEMSENGQIIVAANSCHDAQICSPGLVIDAIKKVVNSVRGGR